MTDEERATQIVNEIIAEEKAVKRIKEFIIKHKISCPESLYDNDRAQEEYANLICEICDLLDCYYIYPED